VARDEQEERQIRKLAASRHGPADWIMHARMLVLSWEGKRVEAIAQEVQCSAQTRAWMAEHPRLHHVFLPTGACWLNVQEGWWRLFRRDALAGQSFATPDEIEQATRLATTQLNRRAKPWIWGRPAKDHRHYRRVFCYRI
jgi:transposase